MAIAVKETGIVPIVEEELLTYDESTRQFRGGSDPIQFQMYRLREGVYGQRQDNAQMIRVKLPGGIVTAQQAEALGEIARSYAPRDRGHITTRECIQYHHLTLEDAGKAKWLLASVGVTSREACGNTVRNVVTCPLAGVCRNEEFDVVPYLTAYVRFFIRKPFTQTMPRKFKTSFSPCASDCATAPFHDLGFIGRVRVVDGVKRQGFAMYVGGGSSIMPRAAQSLYEFVPVEDYLRISEAVLRVFNKSDELRKNRMMARIKVLIDRIGMDRFRELVEAELEQAWAKEGNFDPAPYMINDYETTPGAYAYGNGHEDPAEGDAGFQRWKASNVTPQRQGGYYAVHVKVAQGDLSSDQFDAVARLSREFGNGQIRLTVEQNFVFRWVPRHRLHAMWKELGALGLDEAGVNEITDTTSCPGTDSCKLGITASMGANRAIRDQLISMDIEDPLVRSMHIKMSGCPNGCGRHHLAHIGFQGASVKGENGQQVPAYEVYIGGSYDEGEAFRYAKRVSTRVPSKRAPEAVGRIVTYYQNQRQDGETFNRFVDRVGYPAFEELLADLRPVGTIADNVELYQDWERAGLYKLERGEGECAV
ncbi:MAG: nitrite/sulfite reductase [Chloroflexota bacterium]